MYPRKIDRLNAIHNFKYYEPKTFVIIGCGCMGRVLLYWINHIFVNSVIIIIDKSPDKLKFVEYYLKHNPDARVTPLLYLIDAYNYKNYLNFIIEGTIVVDASYDISTIDIIKLCNEKGACYINTAIEDWGSAGDIHSDDVSDTLLRRTMLIDQLKCDRARVILTMGCNPGNVSLWTKYLITLLYGSDKITEWNQVAETLGIHTIHISEHDTQVAPLQNKYSYANTWSEDPFSWLEEALAPVEITIGTHEEIPPEKLYTNNGKDTVAMSWTPNGLYYGMLIRHEENITIGKFLSNERYCPSVYYVYHPSDNCMLYTLNYDKTMSQLNSKLLTHEIIAGSDELGVTIFLSNGDAYWVGSTLDIQEAREQYNYGDDNYMFDYINATNSQVVAGYITGIFFLLNTDPGIYYPEDIPLDYLSICLMFQGNFITTKIPHDFRNFTTLNDFIV